MSKLRFIDTGTAEFDKMAAALDEEAFEYVKDIAESVTTGLDDGMSAAFCLLENVLYIRIYDRERYVFPLPIILSEDADGVGACINLSEYAVREMIPLIISDIPRDELDTIADIFPHIDAKVYGDDDDSFFVKVNNECDLIDCVPNFSHGDILLDEIKNEDIDIYAELCVDRELNKYWGYDASIDNPTGYKQYYLDTAKREFSDGIAITLAIRHNGAFAGEATIYGFDYRGCADISVRILPKYHGMGLGTKALYALIELARAIGLKKLRTSVMSENTASVKMTGKVMRHIGTNGEKEEFSISL